MKQVLWFASLVCLLGLGCEAELRRLTPAVQRLVNTVEIQTRLEGDTGRTILSGGTFRMYASEQAALNRTDDTLATELINTSWEGFDLDPFGSGTYWIVADRVGVRQRTSLQVNWSAPAAITHAELRQVSQEHLLVIPVAWEVADTFMIDQLTYDCPTCPPGQVELAQWVFFGSSNRGSYQVVWDTTLAWSQPLTLSGLELFQTFGKPWDQVRISHAGLGGSPRVFTLNLLSALGSHSPGFPEEITFSLHGTYPATLTLQGRWRLEALDD